MSQRLWLSLWALFWSAAAWNTGARAQTRLEFHLLPAVSTGPPDPAFSPDGGWIAFSMRGDIWKVPATGGDALALTQVEVEFQLLDGISVGHAGILPDRYQ